MQDEGELNLVNTQDEYTHKASERLDLAKRTDGGADSGSNKFFTITMLWLRLAEEIERQNRFDTPSHDRT